MGNQRTHLVATMVGLPYDINNRRKSTSLKKLKGGNAEPYARYTMKARAGGGRRGETCDHGLPRKRSLRVHKSSYELS